MIGGYTAPRGSRSGFGALLLGVHDDDGTLVYCGNVGTGFDETAGWQTSRRGSTARPATPRPFGDEARPE